MNVHNLFTPYLETKQVLLYNNFAFLIKTKALLTSLEEVYIVEVR